MNTSVCTGYTSIHIAIPIYMGPHYFVLKACMHSYFWDSHMIMDGYTQQGKHWIYAHACMGVYRYTRVYMGIHGSYLISPVYRGLTVIKKNLHTLQISNKAFSTCHCLWVYTGIYGYTQVCVYIYMWAQKSSIMANIINQSCIFCHITSPCIVISTSAATEFEKKRACITKQSAHIL